MKTLGQYQVKIAHLACFKIGNQPVFEHFYNRFHHIILQIFPTEIVVKELPQDLSPKVRKKRNLTDPTLSFKSLYNIAESLITKHYDKLVRQLKLELNADINKLKLSRNLMKCL